jgi:hypothetical protein
LRYSQFICFLGLPNRISTGLRRSGNLFDYWVYLTVFVARIIDLSGVVVSPQSLLNVVIIDFSFQNFEFFDCLLLKFGEENNLTVVEDGVR